MNSRNLKNLSERSPEERRKIASAGGKASAAKKKELKTFKETINAVLSWSLKKGKEMTAEEISDIASAKGQNIDVQTAIIIAQVQKALNGDTQAAIFVRDSSGNKPSDKLEVTEVETDWFIEDEKTKS